ncbi:hypothetical protein QBC34DRAFT_443621 [Podospora aff. communis PSN243]|uniref:Serine protease n=1 Tax=Podospora aff. communis PSN243 TaxID=3040156 RepID=A0AAV9G4B1_9PEZI|nr:hypothetical protein QBC34DRAFT_443621 [Podospora aff. communis PSN243]
MAATSSHAGLAATWVMPNLAQPPTASVVGAESHFTLESTSESVFDPDLRSVVDKRDFFDGGKYRSVVKLMIRYEGQRDNEPGYAMGTGWLISPDTVVTAGHNVFDWSGFGKGLGRAVQIKCYIGYQGAASVNSPEVQFRLAKNIVTTPEWISGRNNRHRDISFIQVDRPFTGDLRVFRYEDTPAAEDQGVMLGVVGYPGDMSIDVNNRRERGAEMYEMFAPQAYSLSGTSHENPLGMLEYTVSTFGGQSGAPVIRKDTKGMTVIGTHVYGAGTKNQASVIGPLGNDYKALLRAFGGQLPVVTEDSRGIKLVRHSSPTSANRGGFAPAGPTADAESFFDVFKDVARFAGGKVLPVAAPMVLGPVGAPLAAIAGAAIGAMANRAESTFDDSDAAIRGAAERAVLAESALQTVLKMEQGPVLNKVIGDMQQTYSAFAPGVKTIAPKLAPALADAAQQIHSDHEYMFKNTVPRTALPPRLIPGLSAESAMDDTSDLMAGLLQHQAKPLVGEEAFFDGIGSFIGSGFRMAKPFLRAGAKGALGLLEQRISAESAWDQPTIPDTHVAAAELVAKRAIIGEAALQSLEKLSKFQLHQLHVVDDQRRPATPAEESIFEAILRAVQSIGSVVASVAPTVIKTVVPIAGELVGGGSESPTSPATGEAPKLRGRPGRSLAELLRDGDLRGLSIDDNDPTKSFIYNGVLMDTIESIALDQAAKTFVQKEFATAIYQTPSITRHHGGPHTHGSLRPTRFDESPMSIFDLDPTTAQQANSAACQEA